MASHKQGQPTKTQFDALVRLCEAVEDMVAQQKRVADKLDQLCRTKYMIDNATGERFTRVCLRTTEEPNTPNPYV